MFKKKEKVRYVGPLLSELDDSQILSIEPTISKEEYFDAVRRSQSFLSEGESYELNFTFDSEANAIGDPFLLYQKLKRKQRTKCSAFFFEKNTYYLSLSPEIFWQIHDRNIKTFPMKGTAKRMPALDEDNLVSLKLRESEKERAENVMITDLFRNDLGKISEIGSVAVTSLFKTEAFDTVWQMTSEIESRLHLPPKLSILLQNLFPSGSVTGAPKIRSMELLNQLEKRQRGLYTGSIITWHKENEIISSSANVAIRTLQLQKIENKLVGHYGVGSGITVLSNPEQEYEECLAKLSFLSSADTQDFEILETLRFYSGRFRFLNYHLDRMKSSCQRLGYPFDYAKAKETLDSISHVATGLLRIRLLVNIKGDFRAESFDFVRTNKRRKVNLSFATAPMNRADKFFYHKTTIRDFYTHQLALGSKEGSEDVILMDDLGNISETCLRNLFYKLNGQWFTPSLRLGGLPGSLRQKLLEKKWIQIRDTTPEELQICDLVLVGNSLRGLERTNIRTL